MSVAIAIRKQVPTVPAALKALTAMERQLTVAKTYDEIRRVIKEATALKVLMSDVAEVKTAAEDAILLGNKRIAEELRKVPKGRGPGGKKGTALSTKGKSSPRADTGIKPTSRHRLSKLADLSKDELKVTAARLRKQGKDATVSAVVREITQGDKKERRAERERTLAGKQLAMPTREYGVIVSDDEWDFKVYSRETGMDRHAANHYPTAEGAYTPEKMHEHTKERFNCAAKDCVLAMWVTVPYSAVGHELMKLRGFKYKTQVVWHKKRPGKGRGTGYWFINEHEILLIGVRGNIPAPAPGTQWSSVIEAPVGKHSAKPEIFLQMLEEYFPNLPKIELNRRGKPREGWSCWGNEVELEAAE
jgi:N6-adenosine-specific RNA methylase IME4